MNMVSKNWILIKIVFFFGGGGGGELLPLRKLKNIPDLMIFNGDIAP